MTRSQLPGSPGLVTSRRKGIKWGLISSLGDLASTGKSICMSISVPLNQHTKELSMLWPNKSDFTFGLLQTGVASWYFKGSTSSWLAHEVCWCPVCYLGGSQLKTSGDQSDPSAAPPKQTEFQYACSKRSLRKAQYTTCELHKQNVTAANPINLLCTQNQLSPPLHMLCEDRIRALSSTCSSGICMWLHCVIYWHLTHPLAVPKQPWK